MTKFGKGGVYGKIKSQQQRRRARRDAKNKKLQKLKKKYTSLTHLPEKIKKDIKLFELEKVSRSFLLQTKNLEEYERIQVLINLMCKECRDDLHDFLAANKSRAGLKVRKRNLEIKRYCIEKYNQVARKKRNWKREEEVEKVNEEIQSKFPIEEQKIIFEILNLMSKRDGKKREILDELGRDEEKIKKELEDIEMAIEMNFENLYIFDKNNRKKSVFDVNFTDEFSSFIFQ